MIACAPAVPLSIYDLYLAGVGCDLTGAVLIIVALLMSPSGAAEQWTVGHANTLDQTVRHARDYVNGWMGVTSLCLGFLLQAAGYMLNLSGHPSHAHSAAGVVTGGLSIVLGAGAPALTWLVVRRWGYKRYVLAVAFVDRFNNRHDQPSGRELIEYGTRLGYEARADEWGEDGYARYAKRVYGVDGVRDD